MPARRTSKYWYERGGNAVGAKSDRWSTPFISPSFGDESLMRREKEERRAADRGADAAQLTRGATDLPSLGVPRLYLLGRAVRFLGREEAWAVASGAGAGAGRVSAARGAAGGRVPYSPPRLASRSCFADTHTAWLVRLRHHHEGSCRVAVLYVLYRCLWAGLHSLGLFMSWTRFCVF